MLLAHSCNHELRNEDELEINHVNPTNGKSKVSFETKADVIRR